MVLHWLPELIVCLRATSSWILVKFITAAPPRELQDKIYYLDKFIIPLWNSFGGNNWGLWEEKLKVRESLFKNDYHMEVRKKPTEELLKWNRVI